MIIGNAGGEQSGGELRLGREGMKEAAVRDAGRLAQLLHTDRVIALVDEERQRVIDQSLPRSVQHG